MLLLPFDRFTIKTNLPHQEVLDRFISVIGKPKMFYNKGFFKDIPKDVKPYAGSLTKSKISIYRVLRSYRSSFNPLITGRIIPNDQGVTIRLHFYVHPLILFFMTFWLGFSGYALIASITHFIETGDPSNFTFSAFLFLFGYLLMMVLYKYEFRKSKRFFLELFSED